MVGVWSFYSPETGLFTPARYGGPESFLAVNTPAGCVAILGEFDHQSQRFDVETGQVVDYEPPAPADTEHYTHHWDTTVRRWVATPAPRHFVWNATLTMTGRSRARWACGQAAFGPVHMSTGRLFKESGGRS